MYVRQIETENWSQHKASILSGLGISALGTLAMIQIGYNANFASSSAEDALRAFTLMTVSGILALEGTLFAVQRLFFLNVATPSSLCAPSMVGAGAALLLAAGFCPVLDFPDAVVSAMGGMALSWYGICGTAAASLFQERPYQGPILPV